MTERFKKAYDALVQAFFEGTLAKDNCNACAVGDIINTAQGGTISKNIYGKFTSEPCAHWWADLFVSNYKFAPQSRYKTENGEWQESYLADMMYELTGYTAEEMAQIERAFEHNTRIPEFRYAEFEEIDILEDQYHGLCAVIDVMIRLDGKEPAAHPEYNAKFREHKKLQNA